MKLKLIFIFFFTTAVITSIFIGIDFIVAHYVMNLFPNSINEWFKLINLIIWIVILCVSFRLYLSSLIFIIRVFEKVKDKLCAQESKTIQKPKSKWQEKLDELQKINKK